MFFIPDTDEQRLITQRNNNTDIQYNKRNGNALQYANTGVILGVLRAHPTPSEDGQECWITATFRPHTNSALCRCPMVRPLTIARFGEDFSELQTRRAVRTAPHIVRRTVGRICQLGGQPCRATH